MGVSNVASLGGISNFLVTDLDDHLDLDGLSTRQRGHSDGSARMAAAVAEDLYDEIGKAGSELTIPSTFTTRSTRPRSPSIALSTASWLIAVSRAAS